MALVWTGNLVKAGVPVSAYVKTRGEGFAVFVGEEDDVRMIVGRRTARRESARLLGESDASVKTGGWYRVIRNEDGDWTVA